MFIKQFLHSSFNRQVTITADFIVHVFPSKSSNAGLQGCRDQFDTSMFFASPCYKYVLSSKLSSDLDVFRSVLGTDGMQQLYSSQFQQNVFCCSLHGINIRVQTGSGSPCLKNLETKMIETNPRALCSLGKRKQRLRAQEGHSCFLKSHFP